MPNERAQGRHHWNDELVSANRESPTRPSSWALTGLVLGVVLWLAVVALALDTTINWTVVYGGPGLVVAGLGLIGFRWLCKSWVQGFCWSALLAFAVMFFTMIATFMVY